MSTLNPQQERPQGDDAIASSGHVKAEGLLLPDASNAQITTPEPGLEREVLVHSAAMMLVRHPMRKGWRGQSHSHPHEQMVYVIRGAIEITVEDRTHRAHAGDSLIVSPNSIHEATALEDSLVLDVFTPARQDYL